MFSDDDIVNADYSTAHGSTAGPWPVFEFRDTLEEVTILDYSTLDARISKINVVNDLLGAKPLVVLEGLHNAGSSFRGDVTLEFDVRHGLGTSLVDIQKRGAGDLELTKLINNPVGLTRILNTEQDVIASGTQLVVTNLMEVEATK